MKIPSKWNLPEEIKNRFGLQTAGKQRAMSCDNHLLLILHKAPVEDVNERQAVIYWRDPKGKWLDSSGNQGIYHLQNHLMEYSQLAESLDNYYEQATSSTDYFKLQEELTPLHRAAKNFSEALQAARDAVKEDREIIDLRDQSQVMLRTLDILSTDTRNALDFTIARRMEEQARLSEESLKSSRRLNILVALTLPMTALSSLFGMNLSSGLEDLPTSAFWTLLSVSVLFGMILTAWVLRAEKN